MMKRIGLFFATLLFSAALFAAITLDAAKQQGLVGEQLDGYLGVVVASADVNALVADINTKRQEAYLKIAKKNQLTLEQVAMLAGKKAIDKTPTGQYVQAADGTWVKK
ncbi:YdbL family protein [Corallincola platygyrae]|uniref:YdbL family protein n=1 Tax=Corallincola platygyrae TaxID=1193278 RepID=A0ABW4XK87_9GAMM